MLTPATTLKFVAVGLVLVFGSSLANAQESVSSSLKTEPGSRRMFVDPSSTWVSTGKVSLTVNPLTRQGESYVGNYRIRVVPYFLKNEEGTLEMEASDATVRKLSAGIGTTFTGKATNTKNGTVQTIVATATPSTNVRGNVTISIITENGLMVFNTSYRFGE